MIQQRKKLRSLFIYSLYKQLINKGLTFKHEINTQKIKLFDDSKTIKKSFHWTERNLHRATNSYSILCNDDLYTPRDKWLEYYNELFRTNFNFNLRHIYHISYVFWSFFERHLSHFIFNERFYDQGTGKGHKYLLLNKMNSQLYNTLKLVFS